MPDNIYSESRQYDYDTSGGTSLVEIAGIVVPSATGPIPLSGDANGALYVRLVDGTLTPIATGVQYVEDAALGATAQGTLVIARRDDALSTLTAIEGDAIGLRVNDRGALWVAQEGGGSQVSGDVAHDAVDSGNPVKLGGRASDSPFTAVAEGDRVDARFTRNGSLVVSGNVTSESLVTGGASGFYANVSGASALDSANALNMGGNVAHDAVDSGNPVKIGGQANTTAPAAVANGDRVNAWLNPMGLQGTFFGFDNSAGFDALSTVLEVFGNDPSTSGAIESAGYLFNGTTWDRVREVPSADAQARTGIAAAALMGYNGTTYDRVRVANTGRLQVDVITAPSTAVTGTFWQATQPVSGTVTADTELPAAAALADATANPTTSHVGADGLVFNASTWDRARSIGGLPASDANTGIPAVALVPHKVGYTPAGATAQYSTTQTSTILGATASASQKIAVTSIQIQVGGTVAGSVQVYFGTGAYSRGTSKAIFDGEFAPSATLKPGYTAQPSVPYLGALDEEVRVTTSAALNPITVTIWYYVI